MKKSSARPKKKTVHKKTPAVGGVRWIFALVAGILSFSTFFVLSQAKTPFCANSISCISNLSATVENKAVGIFGGRVITPPKIDLAMDALHTNILGETTAPGEKHIYVDLKNQALYAFQGQALVLKTLISSGKWFPTPPGEYHIWVKLRSTRMSGGQGNDAYDLPNVPYVMFFYNSDVSKARGFSLHGAYWHNNFGHAMSHGCVNMRTIDAQAIYDWADPPTEGTTTYAKPDNQGTAVSICSEVKSQEGSSPLCIQ